MAKGKPVNRARREERCEEARIRQKYYSNLISTAHGIDEYIRVYGEIIGTKQMAKLKALLVKYNKNS